MMAATTLTVEETNHLRAVYLCYRVAPLAVRTHFDKLHAPAQLANDLAVEKTNLQKIRGKTLKQYQWDQLYPPTGTPIPASADFDITLLICLLRNMKPKVPPPPFGFDNLPHGSHTTDGAHVARIKHYRNQLAHSTDGKLSNTEFTNYWSDLEVAIKGLGGSTFGMEVNDAKRRNLDNTLVEILRQMTKYDKQYVELSNVIEEQRIEHDTINQENNKKIADLIQQISDLFLKLDQLSKNNDQNSSDIRKLQKAVTSIEMENIPDNRKELIRMHIEKWKEHDSIFIQTTVADKVYTMIKKSNCLTVTGNPGMGKTMAVRHVALKMLDEGYKVIPISHPEEVVTLFSTHRKYLFVLDDLCGRYTLNQCYLNNIKSKLEDIELILEKQTCKIIATCRSQVFKDVKFKSITTFSDCKCDFNSKENGLTSVEITTFANQYFGVNSEKAIYLSQEYYCFPFLCFLYHTNKGVDFDTFCKNPFKFIDDELDNLLLEGEEGKYKYCALVLCVIHNNHLTENCLTGKIDKKTRKIVEDVMEECELPRVTSPKCLHKSLDTLVGSFVTKEDNYYKMVHDKLFDFVALYLGQKMVHVLIDHVDSGFIAERFLWKALDTNQETTINIPEDEVDHYIDRMISDWQNKEVVDFFSNRNFKSSAFVDMVLQRLNKLDQASQLELVDTVDKGGLEDTPLTRSCFIGNVKFVKWMLSNNTDVNMYTTDYVSPLYIACQIGNIDVLRILLHHRADVYKCDKKGWSPLHTACYNGHTEVVTELLQNDYAKINACNWLGRSPLYLGCEKGCVQIVRDLLRHGADINKCDKDGWSPLHTACFNGHTEVVIELLKNIDLKIDLCKSNGVTSLYIACHEGRVQIVRDLLQHGADINKCDKNGWSALHTACCNGHTEVVIELLKNDDVKIDLCKSNGVSPLYRACEKGYSQIVRDLLQHGADINKCDKDGWSPLHTACFNGHTEVVIELLKNDDVKINVCNFYGRSPLCFVCKKGYVQIVRDLLQHGADINKCDKDGWSPLHTACFNGHTEVVIELLKNDDVKIDLCKRNGETSLFVACKKGYSQIVRDLLQRGADINKCNNHCNSPLQMACIYNHKDILCELLQHNVLFDVHDNDGDTALYSACEAGNTIIVKLLLQQGVNVNKCSNTGESPLLISCVSGNIDIVNMLLHRDADVNLCIHNTELYLEEIKNFKNVHSDQGKAFLRRIKDVGSRKTKDFINSIDWIIGKTAGASALHLACFMGYEEIVKLLMENNPNINVTTDDGATPLFLACEIGHEYLVTLLLTGGADPLINRQDGKSPYSVALDNGHKTLASMLLRWTNDVEILYQRQSIKK